MEENKELFTLKVILPDKLMAAEERIFNSKITGLLDEMNIVSFTLSSSMLDVKPNESASVVNILKNETSRNTRSLLIFISAQRLPLLIKKIECLIKNEEYRMDYIMGDTLLKFR